MLFKASLLDSSIGSYLPEKSCQVDFGLVFEERTLAGSIRGSARPPMGLPMLVDLCRAGKLKLDELLTGRYPFPKINETYEALDQGKELRSIVTF